MRPSFSLLTFVRETSLNKKSTQWVQYLWVGPYILKRYSSITSPVLSSFPNYYHSWQSPRPYILQTSPTSRLANTRKKYTYIYVESKYKHNLVTYSRKSNMLASLLERMILPFSENWLQQRFECHLCTGKWKLSNATIKTMVMGVEVKDCLQSVRTLQMNWRSVLSWRWNIIKFTIKSLAKQGKNVDVITVVVKLFDHAHEKAGKSGYLWMAIYSGTASSEMFYYYRYCSCFLVFPFAKLPLI